MAVRATRLGAIDFLEKPLTTEKLLLTVENGLRLTTCTFLARYTTGQHAHPLLS